MQKLFVCHYTEYDFEVTALGEELRLRGVAPWIDHEGGFPSGANVHTEARHVITDPEETFGLVLFATPEVFDRSFIKRIELETALRRKAAPSGYFFVGVPYKMGFGDLSRLSREHLGEDLTAYHSKGIREADSEGIRPTPLRPQLAEIANLALEYRLRQFYESAPTDPVLGINLCTRQYLPASDGDILEADVSRLFGNDTKGPLPWPRLMEGLVHLRNQLRKIAPKPRIRIGGSKHITAAFLIGRVFTPPTVAELSTRQGDDYWATTCTPGPEPFTSSVVDGMPDSESLFVEITATDQDVHNSVRAYSQNSGRFPFVTLKLMPDGGPKRGAVEDNATACAMALQVRAEILKVSRSHKCKDIHLFMAVPQGLATLIGHHLNATEPIQLYEWKDGAYVPSLRIECSDVN